MELIFIENLKVEKGNVLIGKNGQLRFKKNIVEQYKIKEGQRYMIGYDKDEKICKAIYLYPEENMNGFKVTYQNSSYTICAKGVAKVLNLKLPLKTFIEPWNDNIDLGDGKIKTVVGFKLCFINN
jgi:hypothetical protein